MKSQRFMLSTWSLAPNVHESCAGVGTAVLQTLHLSFNFTECLFVVKWDKPLEAIGVFDENC